MWDLQTTKRMNDEAVERHQSRDRAAFIGREEHEREVSDAFDKGYNAGKHDALVQAAKETQYMDEAYANGDMEGFSEEVYARGDIDTPQFDDEVEPSEVNELGDHPSR